MPYDVCWLQRRLRSFSSIYLPLYPLAQEGLILEEAITAGLTVPVMASTLVNIIAIGRPAGRTTSPTIEPTGTSRSLPPMIEQELQQRTVTAASFSFFTLVV